ncbi:MAG TPA: hypothetical protein VFK02_36120 [Kofleriaceae bacterium]|nr:hypothetical protein [Kofleriaceae bacterium]
MAVGEWDERQLCSDGACVGVIGPDGTCKVCGRAAPNWGDERKRGLLEPDEPEDEGDEGDEGDEDEGDEEEEYVAGKGYEDDEGDEGDDEGDAAAAAPAERAGAAPNDWTARRLCPDGACIGVIGVNGRCKVCGRAASDAPGEVAASPRAESEVASEPAAGITQDSPGTQNGVAPGQSVQSTATAKGSGDPDPTLVPCSDEACAGVRDREGRCTVCGKVVA